MAHKYIGSKSRVGKTAKNIAKAVGGADLVDYAGSKIAKARAPKGQKKYVKDTTSANAARKSAATVAANIASLAAGGAALGTVARARKARRLIKAGTKMPKSLKIKGQKRPMKVNNPAGYRRPATRGQINKIMRGF